MAVNKDRSLNLAEVRKYSNLEFLARYMVEGFITGLHKSPYHGFSVEFAEHKIFNPGESTRHIDWKIFGKTDRLYTKRYEEETNLRCQIVLDISSSMYYPSPNAGKLTFSVVSAACLAWMLQKQRDAVGLTAFSNGIEYQSPLKSTGAHMHLLLQTMSNLLIADSQLKETKVAPTLHQVADSMKRRSLIVIFTDAFSNENPDELFDALQHMKHNKHEVLLFHVHDKETELNFNFEDRPYEFIDLEDGQKLKLRPQEVKSHYTTAVANHIKSIKLKCNQYKIDFVEADILQSVDQVLQAYLNKRQKMR